MIDPLKVDDQDQNQLIQSELLSKFDPYVTKLTENFEFLLMMEITSFEENEEYHFKVMALSIIIDYQIFYLNLLVNFNIWMMSIMNFT